MEKSSRRHLHFLWILPTTALLAAFGASFFVKIHSGSFTCIDCGLCKSSTSLAGLERATFHRSEMTDWYEDRIGSVHHHQWIFNGTEYSGTVWGQGGVSCGFAVPWGTAVAALNRLRRTGQDASLYTALTRRQQDHRRAAWNALEVFQNSWTDEQVDGWWRKGRRFLDHPGAWHAGFERFD